MTERDQLLFSIAFALRCKARFPMRKKDAPPLEVKDYTPVASAVLSHLEESGYKVVPPPYSGTGPGLHAKT